MVSGTASCSRSSIADPGGEGRGEGGSRDALWMRRLGVPSGQRTPSPLPPPPSPSKGSATTDPTPATLGSVTSADQSSGFSPGMRLWGKCGVGGCGTAVQLCLRRASLLATDHTHLPPRSSQLPPMKATGPRWGQSRRRSSLLFGTAFCSGIHARKGVSPKWGGLGVGGVKLVGGCLPWGEVRTADEGEVGLEAVAGGGDVLDAAVPPGHLRLQILHPPRPEPILRQHWREGGGGGALKHWWGGPEPQIHTYRLTPFKQQFDEI